MATIKCGIFGTAEVERDEDGFIEMPVIIQASGLYCGSAPPELHIHSIGSYLDDEFTKAWVAKLNRRRTDLPFYYGKAKIRVSGPLQQITDADLSLLGIEPLPED